MIQLLERFRDKNSKYLDSNNLFGKWKGFDNPFHSRINVNCNLMMMSHYFPKQNKLCEKM